MRTKYLTYTISNVLFNDKHLGYAFSSITWELFLIDLFKHATISLYPARTWRSSEEELYVDLSGTKGFYLCYAPKSPNKFLKVSKNIDLFKPFPFSAERRTNENYI